MNKRLENVLRDVLVEYKASGEKLGVAAMNAWLKYALEKAEQVHNEDVKYLRGQIKERDHLIEQMKYEHKEPHHKHRVNEPEYVDMTDDWLESAWEDAVSGDYELDA